MTSNDDEETDVTLIYNRRREIVVKRKKLSRSCPYFYALLYGHFKEAEESRISLILARIFPFDIFKDAINFACTGDIKLDEEIGYYISLGVLARFWIFDKLTEVVAEQMIRMIGIKTICDIHTYSLALGLSRVFEECIKFEAMVERQGTIERNVPRCAILGHDHHYLECEGHDFDRDDEDDGWDVSVSYQPRVIPTRQINKSKEIWSGFY